MAFLALAWTSALPGIEAQAHDWPSMAGPLGTYAAPADTRLIDDIAKLRKVWESEERRMGYGKTTTGGPSDAFRDLPPGGFASPIIRGDLLINAYFRPSGDVIDETWRKADGNRDPSGVRYKIAADDLVIAIDTRTGKTRWKFVAEGKGLSRPMGKRNGWGITPAASADKVFAIGTTGILYALDLASGKPAWEAKLPSHEQCLQIRKDCLASRTVYGPKHPFASIGTVLVVGGTVIAPDLINGIVAFEAASGKQLWAAADAGGWMPAVVRVGGKPFIATASSAGKLRLYDLADGRALWEHDLKVYVLHPPVGVDDIVLTYEAHPTLSRTNKKGVATAGALTAFRATTAGPQRLWQLDKRYSVPFEGDVGCWRQLAVRNGLVYTCQYEEGKADQFGAFLIANLIDGKVLATAPGSPCAFGVWGDRIWSTSDSAHRPRNAEVWQMYTADPKDFRKIGSALNVNGSPPLHIATGGYNILLYDVFSDGFLYARTAEGFTCYDLRNP